MKTVYRPDETTNPYSRYWKRRAMQAFWDYFRGQACVVCRGLKGTAGHHLLPLSTHPHLCAELRNGVPLCFNCHRLRHDGNLDNLMDFVAIRYPEKAEFLKNAPVYGAQRTDWKAAAELITGRGDPRER